MKPVMIIESNNTPLAMHEEVINTSNKKEFQLGGIFTEFSVLNRNQRIYTAEKFLPCLEELNTRITTLGVYGQFDHPDVFDTSLQYSSHLIKEAIYNKEANRVEGKIRLLPTYWGKEARALVEAECPIFVSSRAAGVTEQDGTVSLKKLFTYDIVADPGFGSAKMNCINESLNYSKEANFRIYEMSDESKINDIFNMNKNDMVTKTQLAQYSDYLVKEIGTIKKSVNEAITTAKMDPKELTKLLEYYDNLNTTNTQMVKYLDYLSEKFQVVVNDNKNLREVSEKLVNYCDYMATTLEKSINYSEELAVNLDNSIRYTEHVAGKVDEVIDYSEHISEGVNRVINYGNYIAENLDKAIAFADYITENVSNSIAYMEHLSEHVEGNIAYSEYIAEHLDDTIDYGNYISENLDKALSYAGMIAEKLNSNKINENSSNLIPTLEDFGFEENDEEDEYDLMPPVHHIKDDNIVGAEENPIHSENPVDNTSAHSEFSEIIAPEDHVEAEEEIAPEIEPEHMVAKHQYEPGFEKEHEHDLEEDEFADDEEDQFFGESDTELSLQIDNLIEEAKKRKIVETNDLHFLKFLNKSQVGNYYALDNEEQELVKIHINENKNYFNTNDVLKLIQEALSVKNESLENRVVRLIPDALKIKWEVLNENAKKSILSQAKLYPDLTNEGAIENFWYTRNISKPETSSKKLVSHDALIQEDKLSDSQVNSILERIKGLK